MSFGFGVSDLVGISQLCWKVYKKCKDSSGNYAELSSEVAALNMVIKGTEELLSQQRLTTQQEVKLVTCRQGCEDVLNDLDRLLVKYESLGTKAQRAIDRVGFGMHDMNDIRLRLISNVSTLDAFNNAYVESAPLLPSSSIFDFRRSSLARLENKMDLLIAEVRAGKREGSVVSHKTFDSSVQNDWETWEALRRELEDVGISRGVITERRQFIIAWFKEAIAAGKLEEDAPSDDAAAESDDDSMMIEQRITEGTLVEGSVRKESSWQSAEAVYSPSPSNSLSPPPLPPFRPSPPQGEKKSRIRVPLLHKLRGSEKQFPEAAMPGDCTSPVPRNRQGLASWL